MPSSGSSKDKVAKSLSNLSLTADKSKNQPGKSTSKKEVADSWEDSDDESQSEDGERTPAATSPRVPSAPPPTPYSPHHGSLPGWRDEEDNGSSSARAADPSKRPEKTDAVARRMIAASLGLKAPKQTEEQRAYQRSIREQEKQKRDQEKAEEKRRIDEAEKAKAAIWDD